MIPSFKYRKFYFKIWSGFGLEFKSKLTSMPKNWHKTTHFVRLFYDSQLVQFMGIVSCGILREDGALVH